jgi:hypothetical protein
MALAYCGEGYGVLIATGKLAAAAHISE